MAGLTERQYWTELQSTIDRLPAILILLLIPLSAQAFEWLDLWMRPDQRAARQLSQGLPDSAAQQFTDPAWRGMALYQAGDYAGAADAFAQSNDVNADYNRGNALARAGQLSAAAQAYRDALAQVPAHMDAKANLTLIESLLQQQNQMPEQDQTGQQPGQQHDDNAMQQQNETEGEAAGGSDQAAGSEAGENEASLQNDSGDPGDPGDSGNHSATGLQNSEDSDSAQPSGPADTQGMESYPQDMIADQRNRMDNAQRQDQHPEEREPDDQSGEAADERQIAEDAGEIFASLADEIQYSDDMDAIDLPVTDPAQQPEQQPEENELSAESPADDTHESHAAEQSEETVLPDDALQSQDEADADTLETAQHNAMEQLHPHDEDQEVQTDTEPSVDETDESLFVSNAADVPRTLSEPELEQELEQWLRQIPDTPSGLLRRKFMIEYKRRQEEMP